MSPPASGPSIHAWGLGRRTGASLALDDAMALGHLLNDTARPVGEVFADLERRRKDRAESISAVARSNDARSLKSLGPFGCWMRDRAFRWLAPLIARGLEKQYSAQVT